MAPSGQFDVAGHAPSRRVDRASASCPRAARHQRRPLAPESPCTHLRHRRRLRRRCGAHLLRSWYAEALACDSSASGVLARLQEIAWVWSCSTRYSLARSEKARMERVVVLSLQPRKTLASHTKRFFASWAWPKRLVTK